MHPIRRDILRRLILNSQLRFAQLKPEEVESNHFIYYLKQLIGEGLVEKDGELYALTEKGRHWAGTISLESLQPRLQPKIMTAPVLFDQGKVLLHRRRREPYNGSVSLVNGKIHYGETVADASERELKEKTGLTADMKHAGMVYLIYNEQKQTVNHLLSHIFVGENPQGELISTEHSEPFWIEKDKVDELDYILSGTLEILKLIQKSKEPFFFAEYEFDIDNGTRMIS